MRNKRFKFIKYISIILLFLLCIVLTGCGEATEEPGFYLFDNDTYSYYVDLDVSVEKIEKDTYRDSLEFSFDVEPTNYAKKNLCVFINCILTVKVVVNETVKEFNLALNTKGEYSNVYIVTFPGTYSVQKSSYINGATGEVEVPLYNNAFIKQNGITYCISKNEDEVKCIRYSAYDFDTKILYFEESVETIYGAIPVAVDFGYCSESFLGVTTANVEVLIFEGSYNIEELFNNDLCEKMKHYFPNLKILVIKEARGLFFNKMINFPETGVDIYIGCNEMLLLNLRENPFVKAVYGYDKFNVKDYE